MNSTENELKAAWIPLSRVREIPHKIYSQILQDHSRVTTFVLYCKSSSYCKSINIKLMSWIISKCNDQLSNKSAEDQLDQTNYNIWNCTL